MQQISLASYNTSLNTQNKPYNKTNLDSNGFYYAQNELSFKGIKKNTLVSALIYALSMFSGYTLCGVLENKVIDYTNENQIFQNVGWEKNVRILAPCGQNVDLIALKSTNNLLSSYERRLIESLKRDDINNIEQANQHLSNGYVLGQPFSYKKFYSLQTPGEHLNIFNKNETGKQRFVLLLT